MKNRIGRNEDGSLDDIVVSNVDLHIEQMDKNFWWIGIYNSKGKDKSRTMLLEFYSKKKIIATIQNNDLIDE